MLVGAKVCDLTEDLLWFVCGLLCGNFDVSPSKSQKIYKEVLGNYFHATSHQNLFVPSFGGVWKDANMVEKPNAI